MKKNAVIYARVSSTTDRQNTDRQVIDLQAYADRNDMEVVRVFEEKISGAKKNTDRPILQECLAYCEGEAVDVLLISELSRLGRNVYEVQENVKRCIDEGLNIYFLKENFSLFNGAELNPFAPIFVAVLGTCAAMEREAIAYRLNSGREQYIANGGKLGRKLGSTKSKEKKADEYKQVIKELKKGLSVRKVAKLCGVSVSTTARIKREFEL